MTREGQDQLVAVRLWAEMTAGRVGARHLRNRISDVDATPKQATYWTAWHRGHPIDGAFGADLS